MTNAVEFLIGLAIGSGIVGLYYFIRLRRADPGSVKHHERFRQAMTMFGVCAVLVVIGEILLHLR